MRTWCPIRPSKTAPSHSARCRTAGFWAREVVRSGKQSLKLSGQGQWIVCATPTVPYEAHRRYRGAAWVTVDGEQATAAVKLDFHDAQEKYLGSSETIRLTGSRGWTYASTESTRGAFPEAKTVSLAVALEGGGVVYFDDLEFTVDDFLASEEPDNLVLNPSFETAAESSAPGWSLDARPRDGYLMRIVGPAREGRRCLRLMGDGEYATCSCRPVTIERGKTYTVRGLVRASGPQVKAYMKIDYLARGTYLGTTHSDHVTQAAEWVELAVTSEPADFAQATEIAATCAIEGKGQAWFDAVTLKAE